MGVNGDSILPCLLMIYSFGINTDLAINPYSITHIVFTCVCISCVYLHVQVYVYSGARIIRTKTREHFVRIKQIVRIIQTLKSMGKHTILQNIGVAFLGKLGLSFYIEICNFLWISCFFKICSFSKSTKSVGFFSKCTTSAVFVSKSEVLNQNPRILQSWGFITLGLSNERPIMIVRIIWNVWISEDQIIQVLLYSPRVCPPWLYSEYLDEIFLFASGNSWPNCECHLQSQLLTPETHKIIK